MNLTFRKMDPENDTELQDFCSLMGALAEQPEDPEKVKEGIRRMNARPDSYLMVCKDEDAGHLAGTVMAVTFEDFCGDCSPLMILENAIVSPAYQGKGVGKAMFSAIEDWGRERGVHYVSLCSSPHRTGAHAFYHAIGYQDTKGFKKYLK